MFSRNHERLLGWQQVLTTMDLDLALRVQNARFMAREIFLRYDPDMVEDQPGFAFDLLTMAIELRRAVGFL